MTDRPPLDDLHREMLQALLEDASFRRAFAADPGQALYDRGLLTEVPPDFPARAEIPPRKELEAILASGVVPSRSTLVLFPSGKSGPGGRTGPPRRCLT